MKGLFPFLRELFFGSKQGGSVTRSIVLFGMPGKEDEGEVWYGNGVNKCGESIAKREVMPFVGKSVAELKTHLASIGMFVRAKGKDAYDWKLGDLMIWIDDWCVVYDSHDKIEEVKIYLCHEGD